MCAQKISKSDPLVNLMKQLQEKESELKDGAYMKLLYLRAVMWPETVDLGTRPL